MQRTGVLWTRTYVILALLIQGTASVAVLAAEEEKTEAVEIVTNEVATAPASTPAAVSETAVAPVASDASATTIVTTTEPAAAAATTEPAAVTTPVESAAVATTTEPATVKTAVEATTAPAVTEAASNDPVVVTVDGVSMTKSELDKRVTNAMKAERTGNWPADLGDTARKQYESQVKDLFITRTLLANEAHRQGMTTEDAEVDKMLESLKARMKPGRTLDTMIQDYGITMAELKHELADDRNIEKLLDKQVTTNNAPTEAQMRAFYDSHAASFAKEDKVHARHILVTVKPTDTAEVKKQKREKIDAIRAELVKGADFAETAKKSSDCPSASQGGDLGEFGRGQMVKPFEDAAFSQKKDEIGPVIETQFGYHIIQVTDIISGKNVAYDDVKDQIRKELQSGDEEGAIRAYIEDLRSKAKITPAELQKKLPEMGDSPAAAE